MSGIQVLDSVFVANEIMDQATSEKKDYILFKVDFENAYDSVSWDFFEVHDEENGIWRCLDEMDGSVHFQ